MITSFLHRFFGSNFAKRVALSFGLFLFLFLLQFSVSLSYILKQSTADLLTVALQGYPRVILKSTLHCLFWAAFFTMVYSSVRKKWLSAIIGGGILLTSVILYFTEAILLSSHNMVFNNVTAGIILSSNPSEANAFSKTIFGGGGRTVMLIAGACLVVALVCIALTYVIKRYLRDSRVYRIIATGTVYASLLIGVVYTIPSFISAVKTKAYFYEFSAPLERVASGTIEHLDELDQINASRDLLIAQTERDEITVESDLQPHTLVLIIGESLGRPFMHCYGHPLENTPNFDRHIAEGNMIAFTNVVSPAPSTAQSLTATLTLHTVEDNATTKWYERPAINSVFSKAGYWSYWLSNTEKYGGTMTLPTTSISMVSDETHYTTVQSNRNLYNRTQTNHDEMMLPFLKKRGDIPTNKDGVQKTNLMQIIHLMGSHHTYSDRYPESFDKFKPEDLPVRRDTQKDALVASYHNSVLYNDYVINEVIKFYEQEDAIIIYFSDHSQTLFEIPNDPEKYGHDLSEIGLSVPLMFYMTPSMKAKHPELFDRIYQEKDKRIMNDVLTHSLCQLFGIKTKYSNPSLEVFSGSYNDRRPRVAHGYGQTFKLDDKE